jgi:hypothetical protein
MLGARVDEECLSRLEVGADPDDQVGVDVEAGWHAARQ